MNLLYILLAAAVALSFFPVSAQLSNEAWTMPVNLSHSGAAGQPLMLVDSTGLYHVIWQDTFSGFMYTRGDGTEWSKPVAVDFPWNTPAALRQPDQPVIMPTLIADSNGFVHALWANEENILYYSRVAAKQFGSAGAWTSRQRLAENALALDVAMDGAGRMHMAYVRAKEIKDLPAGIYYRYMNAKSDNWSLPTLLYESPYFRTLTTETAHVDIETASMDAGQQIYAAWDNPARERIYFTRSLDGGKTWDAPLEVDKPSEGATAGGPTDVIISASGNNVFLLWQSDHTGTSCSQFYQNSTDGGATWQERQRKPEDFLDCPDSSDLMEIDETSSLLFSTIQDQVYLQAWDGSKWSDPQLQGILTNFTDSDTNRLVSFSCQQPVLLPGGNLLVVGCDKGDGQDIWWMKRQLVDVADWFPKEAVWNPMVNIATGKVDYQTPILIAENSDRVHAFWTQAAETAPDGPGTAVYYARWEGRQWSQPVSVLSSPIGKTEQPAVAIDPSGHIYIVWSGGQSGEIYFSTVSSSQAVLASAWSKPKQLPAPQTAGSQPDIHVDSQGRLYVVYAIPLNEGRGIYLITSNDRGTSWTDPIRVFDGVVAGWAMVDRPRLGLTGSSGLHLIWTRYSLPSGIGPLGLYYSQSRDGGQTWSPATAVVSKPVVWSEIVGFGGETVHRVWQELSSGRATLWHEASMNNGVTWTRTAPVSIFGDTVGSPAITWDLAGELHLMQVVSRGSTSYVLQHWLWNGSTWATERNLDLDLAAATSIGYLQGSTAPDGHLMVLFTGKSLNRESGLIQDNLYFADRSYQMPEVLPTPFPENTPTPAPVVTEAPPIPQVTLTAAVSPTALEAPLEDPASPGNSWVGSVLVPVAAGLIVLVAILIGVRMRQP